VNFENQIADDDVNRAYSKFETSFDKKGLMVG
jgi:hypothetical protein